MADCVYQEKDGAMYTARVNFVDAEDLELST